MVLFVQEEASRGYFDDFKELKDSKGKLFGASDTLLPAGSAALLPNVQVGKKGLKTLKRKDQFRVKADKFIKKKKLAEEDNVRVVAVNCSGHASFNIKHVAGAGEMQ